MQRRFAIALFVLACILMLSSNVAALPTLNDVLSDDNGNPQYPDQGLESFLDSGAEYVKLTDTDGVRDTAVASILFEFAGLKDTNSFGIYSFSDVEGVVTINDELQIFNGQMGSNYSATITFDLASGMATAGSENASIGSAFGFYLNDSANSLTYYSHNYLNGDNFDHTLLFDLSAYTSGIYSLVHSDVIIAFEDLWGGGDQDWNDMIVGISDVTPAPVPEPATMLLLGSGLIGLAGVSRKKLFRK